MILLLRRKYKTKSVLLRAYNTDNFIRDFVKQYDIEDGFSEYITNDIHISVSSDAISVLRNYKDGTCDAYSIER